MTPKEMAEMRQATDTRINKLQRDKARLRWKMRWQVDDKEKKRLRDKILEIEKNIRVLKHY